MAVIIHQFDVHNAEFGTGAAPDPVISQGSNVPIEGLAFDSQSDESCYFKFVANRYASNLRIKYHWYARSNLAGQVVWGLQVASVTANADSGSLLIKQFADADTITDPHYGTIIDRAHVVEMKPSNDDGLAEDDFVVLRVFRDADNSADTLIGDAVLTSLVVIYEADSDTLSVKTVTGDTTVAGQDDIVNVNAVGGAITVTLPSASGNRGKVVSVKKIDTSTNAVTVTAASGNIDNASSQIITTPYDSMILYSGSSNWWIR